MFGMSAVFGPTSQMEHSPLNTTLETPKLKCIVLSSNWVHDNSLEDPNSMAKITSFPFSEIIVHFSEMFLDG